MADPTPERIAQAIAALRAEVERAPSAQTLVLLTALDAALLLAHIDAVQGEHAMALASLDADAVVMAQLVHERVEARRALAAALAHDSVASGDLDRARAARGRGETVTAACPACTLGIDHQHATAGVDESLVDAMLESGDTLREQARGAFERNRGGTSVSWPRVEMGDLTAGEG